MSPKKIKPQKLDFLEKCPSGITGFDEITFGGLPKGRPTLISGNAGSGKTMFGIEFLYRGATEFGEPGLFISFEETKSELMKNVASLGFDLKSLEKRKLLLINYVAAERNEIEEAGQFTLDGLFVRIGYAIDSIKAKRVVLDTIESLFGTISNHSILRSELRRLFHWLKDKGVTVIITGEKGESNLLTAQGLEDYVSDCVIFLDHRISEQYGTRRIRIIKYRGSKHGTNEYPFLITETGISILPISTLRHDFKTSKERISFGVLGLDEMLGGKGIYRGSTVLITGSAGTGKTSLLSHFVSEACNRGEKTIYVAFEESQDQIMRNMVSIGLDLKKWTDKGLLFFYASRPAHESLEMHLALIMKMVETIKPQSVVFDPISSLLGITSGRQANSLLTRLIDYLKEKNITCIMTNLNLQDESIVELHELSVTPLVDTWVLLRDIENNGERNRAVYIIESRGMENSNQVREFLITNNGIKIVDVLVGSKGILIGSARNTQELINKKELLLKSRTKRILEEKIQKAKEIAAAKIAAIKAETDIVVNDIRISFEEKEGEEEFISSVRGESEKIRQNIRGNRKASERKTT